RLSRDYEKGFDAFRCFTDSASCNNGRISRLDDITRHGDSNLEKIQDGVFKLSMTLEIHNIAAKCDFRAKALFVKVSGGIEARYDGIRMQLEALVNLNEQS